MSMIYSGYVDTPFVLFKSDQVRIVKTTSGKVLFACTYPTQEPTLIRGIQRELINGNTYQWHGGLHYKFPNWDNLTSEYSMCFEHQIPYEIKFVDSSGHTPTSNTNFIRYEMRNSFTNAVYNSYSTYGEVMAHIDMDGISNINGTVYIPITSDISVYWDSATLGSSRNDVYIQPHFLLKTVFTFDVTGFYRAKGRFWDTSDYDEGGGEIIVGSDIYD